MLLLELPRSLATPAPSGTVQCATSDGQGARPTAAPGWGNDRQPSERVSMSEEFLKGPWSADEDQALITLVQVRQQHLDPAEWRT